MSKMISYAEFVDRAARDARRRIGLPPNWWGTRNRARGPVGDGFFADVKYISGYWRVMFGRPTMTLRDAFPIVKDDDSQLDPALGVSKHDSRMGAFARAKRGPKVRR